VTKVLRLVMGDQLTRDISSLRGAEKSDVILMVELWDEATSVKHHKQKIIFVFSAMRHFAELLRQEGFNVDYMMLEDDGNTQSFTGEITRAISRHQIEELYVTSPSEWRVAEIVRYWADQMPARVFIRADDRFLCAPEEFRHWAEQRKQLRMEFFYRDMRRKSGLLMNGGEPEGGQWNYDHDNRKKIPANIALPKRLRFEPDTITQEVITLVQRRFADHFGDAEPFGWAVTRSDALKALNHFIEICLVQFGDYQDAMKTNEDFLFHSVISPYLNFGLLSPREICNAAEAAYKQGRAPLNAVEGFIRQIIGWREYVRGIYWLKMPDYEKSNHLNATRKLPWFYWSGETKMNCMRECIRNSKQNAYAHHIQRLMVTGNFALLAGISPREIEEWYLIVYADALDWVELPNVHGMVMFADGGLLASKPYAASGAYINRMSDYCRSCAYDPAVKLGPKACPFNYLYWNFMIENEAKLKGNPRMAMPYKNLAKMTGEQRVAITTDAHKFLEDLE
jgi:deoxyribodipyrimidine photolyase-related protein